MAAPAQQATEVEFSCPWCNTRLALTRADFERERAVLCPRCSNPVDLEIQRRLARTAPSKPAAQAPAPRREAPAPRPAHPAPTPPPARAEKPPLHSEKHAASTRYSASPEPPLPAPNTSAQTDGLQDWSKPIDIDSSFAATVRPGPTVSPSSSSKAQDAPTTPYGGKIRCPSCGYENAKVPPEFSFGTVPKCAWCSKPLPA
jgi:hypothetical protein